MTRFVRLGPLSRFCRLPTGAARMNFLAAIICLMAFGILVLNFQATPAGAGLDAATLIGGQPSASTEPMASGTAGGSAFGPASAEGDDLNKRIHEAVNGSRLVM